MSERLHVRPDIALSMPDENYEEFDSIQTSGALHRLEMSETSDLTEVIPSDQAS